ncbi:hypothetical protein C2869_14260 [Saccharobesus litoralis]|uniref:Uncharacterized protein n=1 Tax=Saccharobesus litoralis TaxID=2172099 RepID=A0A2S0VTJ4_9ALTE|nr:flagella assembly protein FlgT [Saccharobesus litoralis]AWB67531.1 hypothetical protein C2869_14260 [Saccharobesus litoralis]
MNLALFPLTGQISVMNTIMFNFLTVTKRARSFMQNLRFDLRLINTAISHIACLVTCLLAITLPSKVYATWYESTGSAHIKRGNTQLARQDAVRSAVKDALLFAGATVQSAQQVTNGLLTQDSFEVRASGSVNDIQILNEYVEDGKIFVNLRADIFADERQCFTSQYRKSVALLPVQLQHASHAKVGAVYEFPKVLTEKLFKRLSSATTQVDIRVLANNRLNVVENKSTNRVYSARHELAEVANQTDSQYIVAGIIRDMTMTEEPTTSSWNGLFKSTAERYFDLELRLYNGYTGEKIQSLEYVMQAQWPFDNRRTVDPTSRRFWDSDYGQAVQEQIVKMTGELDSVLKCQAANAKILQAAPDSIRINLGKDNGLQVGDKFKVMHHASFTDKQGIVRPHFVISPYDIVITDVFHQTAVGRSPTEQLLGNVQVGDFVRQINL